MKRLLAALGTIAIMGLVGFAAVWACCGGSVVMSIFDVADTPDPVPCKGTSEITFKVKVGMDYNEYAKVMAQVDIYDLGGALVVSSGPMWIGTIDLSDWDGYETDFPASYEWEPSVAQSGQSYKYAITAWTQNDAGNKSTVKYLPDAGTIDVDKCCVEGIWLEVTPQTFDVTRAGVPVKAHVVLPPGASMLTGGKIIEIGGIPTSIPGTASPDTNLTFSSAAFSAVAAIIVPAGKPRAEDVPILIDVDLADPDAQPCDRYLKDTIDIINEGKGKKK